MRIITIFILFLFNILIGFSQGGVNSINTNPNPLYVSPNVNNFKKNTWDWQTEFFKLNKNGVNVGEIEAKLLKKVEELTLHIIELKKELEQLQTSNK